MGPDDVHVTLAPGLTIRGRLEGATPIEDAWIHAWRGARQVYAHVDGNLYEVRGLSPGRWKIRVDARSQAIHYVGRAEADAGSETEIPLTILR